MKFNEKLLALRKKQGLSQEELGEELQVSRQTVSKWESGQSYPDFQRLVMLSDYFNINLDELVKDIDLEDIRSKNLTDEKIVSIFSDVEKTKSLASRVWKISCYLGVAILVIIVIVFVLKLAFPNADFLWVIK